MRFKERNWIYIFNCLSVLMALGLAFDAWRDSYRNNEHLQSVTHQQEHLRDLLWVSLLMQRSSNLILAALQSPSGEQEIERAKNITDSMSIYLDEAHSHDRPALRLGLEADSLEAITSFRNRLGGIDSAKIRDPAIRAELKEIAQSASRIDANLDKEEMREWFALRQLQKRLLNDRQNHSRREVFLFIALFTYLTALCWALHRKLKADEAVRDNRAKLLNTAKMSALGEMAGGIAHEINNPVATISTIAQQAREVMDDENPDAGFVKRSLENIHRTTTRISAIVNGLRAYSRNSEAEPMQHARVEEIVASTLALCQEKFRNLGVDLRVDPIPAGLMVACRPVQISQVLLNLLSNACDAIDGLPEKWIQVTVLGRENEVEIRVTDSGPGIDRSLTEKIFHPFFTTKEVGQGTGLGLSISKGIVESHGGTFFVDTEHAHTRFVIRLPKGSREQA